MRTRSSGKRVYRGFIDPGMELPSKVGERTVIAFGKRKWYPQDKIVKITVEWK